VRAGAAFQDSTGIFDLRTTLEIINILFDQLDQFVERLEKRDPLTLDDLGPAAQHFRIGFGYAHMTVFLVRRQRAQFSREVSNSPTPFSHGSRMAGTSMRRHGQNKDSATIKMSVMQGGGKAMGNTNKKHGERAQKRR